MEERDVIKALECHSNDYSFCMECPFSQRGECSCELARSTLDLINLQKAEIERLKQENFDRSLTVETWKWEAVEEFAERLHEYINGIIERHEMPMFPFSVAFVSGMETKIDNLLKEMVGEG